MHRLDKATKLKCFNFQRFTVQGFRCRNRNREAPRRWVHNVHIYSGGAATLLSPVAAAIIKRLCFARA